MFNQEMLICRSAAKVNLTLDVLSRRPDGYHELSSIVHTVGLWDTLCFQQTESGTFELRCNRPELETEDNLCLKAARLWLQATGEAGHVNWNGTRITLKKNIPSGAGLGGGSGNAAATLLALTRLYGAALDEPTLHRLASTLGADVPLFLRGGCVLMEGVGETLSHLPRINGWLSVVQPDQLLSTPRVYAEWDAFGLSSANMTPLLQRALQESTVEPVPVQDLAELLRDDMLGNDLSAAAQRCGVDVEYIADQLRRCGALAAGMTGSGSAVFGLFATAARATEAQTQLRGHLQHLPRDQQFSENSLPNEAEIVRLHAVTVAPFVERGVEFTTAERF